MAFFQGVRNPKQEVTSFWNFPIKSGIIFSYLQNFKKYHFTL